MKSKIIGALFVPILVVATAPAIAADFTEPVVVSDADSAEPGIDIAADGTIYINAPVGLLSSLPGAPSFLFRSDDGGQSFTQTDPGNRALLPGGGDSDVALDPDDGTIYFTDLYLADSTVSVSGDKGASWTVNPLGGVVVEDRQWLTTPGDGIVYHTYNQIPGGILVTKSTDGGRTYVLTSVAATPLDRNGFIGPPGPIVSENAESAGGPLGLDGLLDPAQRVGVIYANSTGGIGFARSTDGGLTFTQSVVSPDSPTDTTRAFPVVARAGMGELKAVWLEVVDGRSRVRFSQSDDFGASWSQPKTLVDQGTPVFPWVAARGDKVSVVLYHTEAEATPDTVPEDGEWFTSYLESGDGGSSFSGLTILDPTAVKSGPICTAGGDCDADRGLLDFLAVALDPQDRANVTWARVVNEEQNDTEIRFARQQ